MHPPLTHNWPHVLLLTGAPGSGKSSFASAFAKLGVPCFDLDKVAREIAAVPDHPATHCTQRTAMHPWILAEAQRWSRAQTSFYVIWISGLPALEDSGAGRVLVIDASEALRTARIAPCNPAMLSLQPPRAAYLARADDVIVNEGPLAGIAAIAEQLHRHYLTLWSQE
jgi:dephospho-CoA kinase